jgi:hypothetical protein
MSTERTRRICEMHGFEPDFLYFIKITFKEKPFYFIVICLTAVVLTFGMLVQLFERGVNDKGDLDPFMYVWNPMWMIILAITTVGYGDIYPMT